MMKISTLLIFTLITTSTLAQDKTNIPPGPDIDFSKPDKKVIQKFIDLEKQFLQQFKLRKLICFRDKTHHKEKSLESVYLLLSLKDTFLKPCEPCTIKPVGIKHHEDIDCIFKNSKMRSLLEDVITSDAYGAVMANREISKDSFDQMTEYFLGLIQDYDDKK